MAGEIAGPAKRETDDPARVIVKVRATETKQQTAKLGLLGEAARSRVPGGTGGVEGGSPSNPIKTSLRGPIK